MPLKDEFVSERPRGKPPVPQSVIDKVAPPGLLEEALAMKAKIKK